MHSIGSLRDVLSEKTSFSWGFSIIQASWSRVSMADVVFGFYKNCQSLKSDKKKKKKNTRNIRGGRGGFSQGVVFGTKLKQQKQQQYLEPNTLMLSLRIWLSVLNDYFTLYF